MARIVVVFESAFVHTSELAEHIAAVAQERGHTTKLLRASDARSLAMRDADAVFVVAPIYQGGYADAVTKFVHANADATSLTAPDDVERAARVARSFLARSGLRPTSTTPLAGGLVLRFVLEAPREHEGAVVDYATNGVLERVALDEGGHHGQVRTRHHEPRALRGAA